MNVDEKNDVSVNDHSSRNVSNKIFLVPIKMKISLNKVEDFHSILISEAKIQNT